LKCQVCSREADENGYCSLHANAYRQVTAKYERWKTASQISWKEYLREIAKNPLTGEWAREVAKQLTRLEKE
jgi:hypothetical protein